jgi:methylglutamate dehydrogenase subunit D
MPDLEFGPRSAFDGLPVTSSGRRGLVVNDRDGLGIATVLERQGKAAALAARLRERFGIELPAGPHRVTVGGFGIAGTGPGAWLATDEGGSNAFARELAEGLDGIASVSDQSDGYAVLRLSGPRVRDVLAKLVPIDLHPQVFRPGDVASTQVSHISVTLWRLDDSTDGAAVFEIAVFRSLARSLWHAISESAAEWSE